ncbi:hypothetical protein ACFXJ8_34290 [Nonomuraea sp. NPDC059194]|uniref:hypothetical protein n=1 Tax=Nonomuraea sp. NPDC059194 TaxID=3346764 RepID=UPI00367C9DF9
MPYLARQRHRIACLAVSLSALSACSPAHPAQPGITAEQRELIDQARQELIRRCLEKRGFSFWPSEPADPGETRPVGYVLDDVAWAKVYGYGRRIREKVMAERRANPNRRYLESLTEAQRTRLGQAMYGSSDATVSIKLPSGPTISGGAGGCSAEADTALYGDFRLWFRVSRTTDNLSPLYVPQIFADARYTQAVKAWAGCMRAAGFTYDNPSAIRAGLAKLEPAKEVPLATAEATCALSTPLSDTIRELERHYGGIVRRRFDEEVETRNRLEQTALTRARALLADIER